MKTSYKSTIHACYIGYITQAIVNNLAPILFIVFQEQFGISYTQLGSLILFNFGTQLVVDILSISFADKLGYRKCCIIAHSCAAAGLLLMGILPNLMTAPYAGLVVAAMIYAIGGGLIEVLISPIVEACPGDAKAAAMSLLHSFYCWGQVAVVAVSTLLLVPLGYNRWYILPILWALVPFINIFNFARVPIAPTVDAHERISLKKLFSSRLFVLATVLMICAGASELAMSQWSSLFAEKALGVNKVMGDLLGATLFAVFMGIGRTLYGLKGEKINIRKALMGCAALCIGCYLVTSLVNIPLLALFTCALTGFSVSLMWPGMFSLVAETYPTGGTAMFAVLAMCGDIGCSLGPWITGTVSDAVQKTTLFTAADPEQAGLKMGLLAATIFPIVILIGVGKMKFKKKAVQAVS